MNARDVVIEDQEVAVDCNESEKAKEMRNNDLLFIPLMFTAILLATLPAISASGNEELKAQLCDVRGRLQASCAMIIDGKSDSFVVPVPGVPGCIDEAELRLSRDTLDADLDKAVALLDEYEKAAALLEAESGKPLAAPVRKESIEDRLRNAEGEKEDDGDFEMPDENFNVLESYSDEHKRKQAIKDKMAEDDMAQVVDERRAADARLNAQRDAKRAKNEQNARFQAELDTQATKDAELAAEWKRKHSVGALAKGFFRSLVGGAVTAASGEVGRGVGHRLADSIIDDRYPRRGSHGGGRHDY